MKQLKTLLLALGFLFLFSVSFAYSTEEIQAYNYAYKNGITTMTSIDKANMGGNLTRIAMAKMLSNYAINVLGLTPNTNEECYFWDVSSSLDSQYDYGVTKACQLGLMGVGISNFRPRDTVTRAEFGTVLSRALNAKNTTILNQMNSAKPYYSEHLRYLQREGIMNNISNPSSLERRGRVMLMLMRSDKNYEPEIIEDNYSHVYIDNQGNEFRWHDLTICDPYDSRKCITMMDRNLGATTNDISKTGSYGYHFQWGNNYGFTNPGINGNDAITEAAITTKVSTANQYGPATSWYFGSTFIKSSLSSNDWADPSNDNLWGGGGDGERNNRGYNTGMMTVVNATNRQGPCPEGYHVPSRGEWIALMDLYSNSSTDGYLRNNDDFKNTFKLPFAGGRYGADARINEVGTWANLWSSSPNIYVDGAARKFYINSEGEIDASNSYIRTSAYSVRCFKNDDGYIPTNNGTHSANKIDTIMRGIHTAGCNWVSSSVNSYGYSRDMPNKNWTDDTKFVNKALQDIRDNGESLVANYINEANRVLDSAGLTKRDQCRYSLLIDTLENQKGYLKSYKTENGKTVIGVDFLTYKESISWDDATPTGGWDLLKNTSTKIRYYTLSNDVELEILNVDANGYTKERDGRIIYDRDRKYISNWNMRLNAFCNNEPVYNGEGRSEYAGGEIIDINRNEFGGLCTKTMLNGSNYGYSDSLLDFKFDAAGNIDRISGLAYGLTNAG